MLLVYAPVTAMLHYEFPTQPKEPAAMPATMPVTEKESLLDRGLMAQTSAKAGNEVSAKKLPEKSVKAAASGKPNFRRRGGGFADGVNAYAGRMMTTGAAVFASFDRKAARLLNEQGIAAMISE